MGVVLEFLASPGILGLVLVAGSLLVIIAFLFSSITIQIGKRLTISLSRDTKKEVR
jgi:hypothetical protein